MCILSARGNWKWYGGADGDKGVITAALSDVSKNPPPRKYRMAGSLMLQNVIFTFPRIRASQMLRYFNSPRSLRFSLKGNTFPKSKFNLRCQ